MEFVVQSEEFIFMKSIRVGENGQWEFSWR